MCECLVFSPCLRNALQFHLYFFRVQTQTSVHFGFFFHFHFFHLSILSYLIARRTARKKFNFWFVFYFPLWFSFVLFFVWYSMVDMHSRHVSQWECVPEHSHTHPKETGKTISKWITSCCSRSNGKNHETEAGMWREKWRKTHFQHIYHINFHQFKNPTYSSQHTL